MKSLTNPLRVTEPEENEVVPDILDAPWPLVVPDPRPAPARVGAALTQARRPYSSVKGFTTFHWPPGVSQKCVRATDCQCIPGAFPALPTKRASTRTSA